MKTVRESRAMKGFSLVEMMIALIITMIVMASVLALLQKGQTSFQREPEVADMNQNARYGLDMISRDLTMAGYNTPAVLAILAADGGGDTPDEITIVWADPNFPTGEPDCSVGGGNSSLGQPDPDVLLAYLADALRSQAANRWRNPFRFHVAASFLPLFQGNSGGGNSGGGNSGGGNSGGGNNGGGGGCGTIASSSTIFVDPVTLNPPMADPTQAWDDGMVLFALETSDCNGDGELGIVPFELTQDPGMSGDKLRLNHNPGQGSTDYNHPGGFNGEVQEDCAVIGRFRVIQYRVNPLPPTPNPSLERRDLGAGEGWMPVSRNIENLQVQYAVGNSNNFVDAPAQPDWLDPTTWITQVRVRVDGRSETTNLQGGSEGVFDDGTHLRNSFVTTLVLRNQMAQVALQGNDNYN